MSDDPDVITSLTRHERTEITAQAERYRHQRGAQGLWSRRWLRLMATFTETVDRLEDEVHTAQGYAEP